MSYEIEQQIMQGLPNYSLKATKYVIAHESGNVKNNGYDALKREISFMTRNKANAFVSHWVGGGGRIIQIAPVGKLQYGCGPVGNKYSYAQVELARTDNKKTFQKDYAAYVWLLRKLAKDAGLPLTLDEKGNGIKSHLWISENLGGTDHVDPYSYLKSFGISNEQFKRDIEKGLEERNEDEMIFSSPSLQTEIELTLGSKARRTMIVEAAVKAGAHESWLTKHKNRQMTDADYLALAAKAIIDPQL
jgi:N-acetylmuramoyl-L-alanine amidase